MSFCYRDRATYKFDKLNNETENGRSENPRRVLLHGDVFFARSVKRS